VSETVKGTKQTDGELTTDLSAKVAGYIRALTDQFKENEIFGVDPLILVMDKKGREIWPLESLSREIKKTKPTMVMKYIRCDTLQPELTMRNLFFRICRAPGREPMPDIVFFDGLEAITSGKNGRIFARTFSFLNNERIRTIMSCDASAAGLVAEILLRSRRRKARFLYLALDDGDISSNRLTSIMDCLARESAPSAAASETTGLQAPRTLERERASMPAPEPAVPREEPRPVPAEAPRSSHVDTDILRIELKSKIRDASSVKEILDYIQETLDQLERLGVATHQYKMSRLYVKFIKNLIRQEKLEEALLQFEELMRELDAEV
jgi:hypothetical protein